MSYTVTAKNCHAPAVEVSINENNIHRAMAYFNLCKEGFRDVCITSGETGEVLQSHYLSNEWFIPSLSESECLEAIQQLYREFLER
jgi:hypothetical protein